MSRSFTVRALPAALSAAAAVALAAPAAHAVTLPGLSYEAIASGPPSGPHPTRADSVTMRYIGRFEDGQVFSTSPGDGKEVSTFGVKEVIPGMSAALQLMRPGDHWRIVIPPYLAYGPGRPFTPPASGSAAVQAVQKRGIPPDSTLIFDVELVAIAPPKAAPVTR